MFVVLDTNHFREVAEATPLAANLQSRVVERDADVFLSIVTVHEAVGGWIALINSKTAGRDQVQVYASFQKTILAFQKFELLPFDEEAAAHFESLKRKFKQAGTMDLKIAAICLAHDATLLTRNLEHFDFIPGLRVENWLD